MTEILDFIKRNGNYFALIICFIFLITAFFSVQGKFWEGMKFSGSSLTSDEVSHIPAGLYYLKTHQYFINTEHPYLIKDISAIPLLFLNLNLPEIPEEKKYENIQWEFGRDFLFNVGNNPDLITFWSRTAIIIFNTILLFLAYYFLKKIFGIFPSLIAIFFFAFSPNVIAHSSLVVMDVPLSFLTLLSVLTFSIFLEKLIENKKYWPIFLSAAFFVTLSLLTKFQALILLVALFFGGLVFVLIKNKVLWWKYILLFVAFCSLITIFIGVTYGFHAKNMEIEGIRYQINATYPHYLPTAGKEILSRVASTNFFFKGLTEYLVGTFMITSRAAGAWQNTYFMGNVYGSEGVGFAYFPFLFFTKETLGFLIFLFLALVFAIKDKFRNFLKNPFSLVAVLFILIYGSFSLLVRLNIGIRHIFPITFLVFVLVANTISKNLSSVRFARVSLVLFLLIIVTWTLIFPYYLSYYNILGGGTNHGYQIATDSNYDWGGQDVKRLAKWVKENKIEEIYAHIFTNVPLEYYLGESYQPFDVRHETLPPKGSYLAVSTFEMQNVNYDKNLSPSKKYFQFKNNLIARVGKTIFIFKINNI